MANEKGNISFDPDQWKRVGELFRAASELDPSERSAFLERECGTNATLRAEIAELLDAHENASSLLDRPVMLAPESEVETIDKEPEKGPVQPGEVLAERFKIVQFLGKGGMGQVYEAEDLELGTPVALKFLKPEIALDPRVRKRFHREITLARRVTHINACRIFDLFRHENMVFLTMELLEGETLYEYLRRSGPMGIMEALPLVEQMAAALTAAHEVGIVHRDFKSSNVMLVPGSGGIRAVVTDFGLATSTLPSEDGRFSVTGTGQVLGTPEFMAPEQLQGGNITPATDIYALGLVIFQMLTGKLPFQGDTPFQVVNRRLNQPAPSPRQHVSQLDRKWERTILKCLERDPRDRFQSPGEVVSALKGETSTIQILPKRRHRMRIALVFLLLLVIAGVSFLLWQRSEIATKQASAVLDFQERDWILLAPFENRTGEPLFDGTIEYALQRELSNSRFVNVVPRERIGDALKLMKRSPDTKLNTALAREVALRDGGVSALLTGRIEKLGSTYLLTAEVVNPADAATLSSLTEETEAQEQVLPAVRRLSSRLREALGEAIPGIQQSERKLAKVTTPSLRALHLYTEAESSTNSKVKEELLLQAIAEDPDFASAYIALASAIVWQNPNRADGQGPRPPEDYMPYAERAFELSDTTSERERYLIRGQYFQLKGQYEDAITNFQALLQLHPDDQYALGGIGLILNARLGRMEEGMTYVLKLLEMRPNDFGLNFTAGHNLAVSGNPAKDPEPYIQRATQLLTEEQKKIRPWEAAWLRFYPVHKQWLQGDLDSVLHELEQQAPLLNELSGQERASLAFYVGRYYECLGQLKAAEGTFRLLSEELRDFHLRETALDRAGESDWGPILQNYPQWRWTYTAMLLTRAGLFAEARNVLPPPSEGAYSYGTLGEGHVKSVRGAMALAEGRTEEAIPLLREGVAQIGRFWIDEGDWFQSGNVGMYFLASESLANAYEQQGNTAQALEVLQEASLQKKRVFTHKLKWMRVQLRLAQLYRKLGRESEAVKIETELRALLKYADSDLWLLRQLKEQS